MLQKLRLEFVVITMIIISSVIIAALGSTYFVSYNNQHEITRSTLRRGLFEDGDNAPRFGNPDAPNAVGSMVVVTVDSDGALIEELANYADSDQKAIRAVMSEALATSASYGETEDLAWAKKDNETTVTLAILDISTRNQSLSRQAYTGIFVGITSISVLFFVVWMLSAWVLQPLQDAWDRQRRFVSDASHELKTPLTVLLANAEILLSSRDNNISPKTKTIIRSSYDEAKRMRKLVEDLLELARADEEVAGSNRGMVRKDVDLSHIVEAQALEFEALAFDRNCELVSSIEPKHHMQGDPDQLTRVVRTLLDNATKYAAPHTQVNLTLKRMGRRLCLEVINQGNVINPVDLPHLFERFYRTDSARTNQGTGGYGLGLAIAKAIVENHGGTISATSDAEKGTCFSILFPL